MPVTDETVQRVLADTSAFIATTQNYMFQVHRKDGSFETTQKIIGDPAKYHEMVDALCKLRLEYETS